MIRRPPRSTLFPYTTLSDLTCPPGPTARQTTSPERLSTAIRLGARGDGTRVWPSFWPLEVETISRSPRSEEHTSELQSLTNLVCRLLLEKKKTLLSSARHPS